MFSSLVIFLVVSLYMVFLFALATRAERYQERLSRSYIWIYGLALGVFHTSWAFYGNVGDATQHGFRFLVLDFGSYACLALWFVLLRRMVQVKEAFHVTSLADLVAARYNRSQYVAALVSLIALFGSVPYVGLQIKAIIDSIAVVSYDDTYTGAGQLAGFISCAILLLFTILFGIRRLDPTEHHYGMMVVLALECVIKLLALLAVGLFVSYGLNDGLVDLYGRIEDAGLHQLTSFNTDSQGIASLAPLFIIGFFGVLLLPRQIHIAVVENGSQNHIKPAAWILAAYITLFSLFVVPIAGAGLLEGLPIERADMFVLLLPLQQENGWLTLSTFLGGFAAASGMVMITTTTVATMVANHLVLPLAERFERLAFLRAYLLQVRWAVAFTLIFSAYVFVTFLVGSTLLSALGTLAITAMLQIMPALLGGLFWRRGNTRAALVGMTSGLLVWFYTLLLPVLLRENGWMMELLVQGPMGIAWLRPEALLGIDVWDSTTHALFFSLGVNCTLYLFISLLSVVSIEEGKLTDEFMELFKPQSTLRKVRHAGLDSYIDFEEKQEEVRQLLAHYLHQEKADVLLLQVLHDLRINSRKQLNIIELVEFHRMVEHELAGSIGAASSHSAIQAYIRYSEQESNDLKALYHHLASEIKNRDASGLGQQERDQTIDLLQSRIALLESDISEKERLIEILRDKLDSQYEEVFRYRVENQKYREAHERYEQERKTLLASTPMERSELEEENRRLKMLYAELSLENKRLQKVLGMNNGSHPKAS